MKITEQQKKIIERCFNGELGVISKESKNGVLFMINTLEIANKFVNGKLVILEEDVK